MRRLEIAVGNLSSALVAQAAGAHRIELCDNWHEGGTTPGYGYLLEARQRLNIPVYPIIRPRGGDFLYSESEWEVMKHDVILCRELGFDGIVTGMLQANGKVDTARTSELVSLARPLAVTFHRAFDRTIDPFQALEDIVSIGCERILTSGQSLNAMEGADLIQRLVRAAGNRICIMPGGGVRADNLATLINATGADEFHSSARMLMRGAMQYVPPQFGDADQMQTSVDVKEIEAMLLTLVDNDNRRIEGGFDDLG